MMAIQINHKRPHATAKTKELPPGAGRTLSINLRHIFGKRIKPEELVFFFSQLSLMLEIQMSLRKALENIGIQTPNLILKTSLLAIIKEIEEGRQLSDAMGHHPELFKPLYVSMIRAGETGGYLKEILDRIMITQLQVAVA